MAAETLPSSSVCCVKVVLPLVGLVVATLCRNTNSAPMEIVDCPLIRARTVTSLVMGFS